MIVFRVLGVGLLALALAPALGGPTEKAAAPSPYARALELYRGGDSAAAAAILERALERGSAAADAPAQWTLLGWCRLRLGDAAGARAAFDSAVALAPARAEAHTGLGYAALREGKLAAAQDAFERSLALEPDQADAWKGLGIALRNSGAAGAEAVRALERAVALAPHDAETAGLLADTRRSLDVPTERRPRPAVRTDSPPRHDTRAGRRLLEVRAGEDWRPFFVKGVNLGTALPGRWPVEFPDDPALYRQWFEQIAGLGANAVRLYTLHPPSLYRALSEHNLAHPERRLRLIQGVWIELPPRHDFDDAGFRASVVDEVRRVIDAVHGNLELPRRAGRAHGNYDADVSADLLAWLLGREWEPFAVKAYDERGPQPARFDGRYVRVDGGSPMESWLGWLCEAAAEHETGYYGRQHPIAFVSWPTLDPLRHPTEATAAEEARFKGEPAPHESAEVYDEDGATVDPTRLRATAEFPAGLFASYHVYPYYPDFMILDPSYARPRADGTVDRYRAYLDDLAAHHGDQPLLIAEFGVPSSRGISHLHPEGLHHGGHTTAEQGRIDAGLLRAIHDADLAGGIVFSWIDEWFKRNWAVADRVVPAERNRLWLNALNPEQHYGLIAALPGPGGPPIVLDGATGDWSGVPPLYDRPAAEPGRLRQLRATRDEGYLYLLLGLARKGRPIDWEREAFWIGIDTYDAEAGDHRLPDPAALDLPIGLEFLARFEGPRASRLLVDPPYRIVEGQEGRPCRSEPNRDGAFTEILAVPNRERFGRDGTRFPSKQYSRSPLRHGTTDPASPDFDSLADWIAAADGSAIEIRIPWGMLNVTDPSSRRVIHEHSRKEGPVETAITEGFRFAVVALGLRPGRPGRAAIVDRLPATPRAQVSDYPVYAWPVWELPTYHLRPKPAYDLLRRTIQTLP